MNDTYRGYIGEFINGQYELGLQPGHQVTVQVPIAFWDGGRQFMVDNGPVPLTSPYDPGYPLQANGVWSYNPSATPTASLGPGLSYIVYPTTSNPMPLYGANFADPKAGPSSANPNAVVMWYHELSGGKPHVFGDNLPAVITEASLRDPLQPLIAPDMLAQSVHAHRQLRRIVCGTPWGCRRPCTRLWSPAPQRSPGCRANMPGPGQTRAPRICNSLVANFTTEQHHR